MRENLVLESLIHLASDPSSFCSAELRCSSLFFLLWLGYCWPACTVAALNQPFVFGMLNKAGQYLEQQWHEIASRWAHALCVLIPKRQDWNADNETRWRQSETYTTSLLQDAERLMKPALSFVLMSSSLFTVVAVHSKYTLRASQCSMALRCGFAVMWIHPMYVIWN